MTEETKSADFISLEDWIDKTKNGENLCWYAHPKSPGVPGNGVVCSNKGTYFENNLTKISDRDIRCPLHKNEISCIYYLILTRENYIDAKNWNLRVLNQENLCFYIPIDGPNSDKGCGNEAKVANNTRCYAHMPEELKKDHKHSYPPSLKK